MIRIERVDPLAMAEPASAILLESWPRPCIHYSPAYLRWQLSFPGTTPSVAVAAFGEGEPIACIATTPRRLRWRGIRVEVHVASFMAVRPSWRGRGVANRLFQAMLDALRDYDRPIVSFAEPDSAGDWTARSAYPAAGFGMRPLGAYPLYGFLPRPGEAPAPAVKAIETADPEGFLLRIGACTDDRTLWNDPDAAEWAHYQRDPRERATVELYGPSGEWLGGAVAVRSEVATAHGVDPVTTLESVFLPQLDSAMLRALCQYACGRWSGAQSSPAGAFPLTAPNAWGIDPLILRAAGLRQTPRRFVGYLAHPDPKNPLLDASGTNLEIV